MKTSNLNLAEYLKDLKADKVSPAFAMRLIKLRISFNMRANMIASHYKGNRAARRVYHVYTGLIPCTFKHSFYHGFMLCDGNPFNRDTH